MFEAMTESFPAARWYVEEISEIRELIKGGEMQMNIMSEIAAIKYGLILNNRKQRKENE